MTSQQRQNLTKLAELLPTVDENRFDMEDYVCNDGSRYIEGYRTLEDIDYHDCNTVCCALGWSPHLLDNAEGHRHFLTYSLETFGLDHITPGWNWIFGHEWKYVDNTVQGVCKRIHYYLEHGVPEGFSTSLFESKSEIKAIMQLYNP